MTTAEHDAMVEELTRKLADPVFKLAMEVFLGELMQEYLVYHQGQVQAIADWAGERQVNRIKTGITKRYLVDRLAEVRKSHKGIIGNQGQRPDVWNEMLWQRSPDGKFARYVGTHPELKRRNWSNMRGIEQGVKVTGEPDLRRVVAENINLRSDTDRGSAHSIFGQLNPAHDLPADVTQRQHLEDVNAMMSRLTWGLADATGDPSMKQRVQYVISSPDGYHRVLTPPAGKLPQVSFETGERVQFMTPVGPDNPVTVAGRAANVGYLAGMTPEQAAKSGAVANDIHRAMGATDWGTKVQATANAMRVLSNNNKYAVQANAVAQLMNILGPGGSRAFGNKLQQLSYRYLGQEAPEEFWGPAAKEGRQPDSKGNPEPIRTYELKLARDLVPSIPSGDQYRLALQAGSTPPSRGYLLDRSGNVVNESVGYADDWYTPFDLRKLPKVRGGSYVRTRGYGGITPEDLRLAMRTGANRITVISNNGMFTLEFNPKAMHFGHRYGYAGNSMVRRYAKALDAIHGQQVRLGDGPDTGSGSKMQLNTDGYLAAMRDLQMRNPYFIREEDTAHPFYRDMRDFGGAGRLDTTGPFATDSGYSGPLDIHAKLAAGGWSDSVARDLYTDANGKFAYSSDARSVLMHDRLLGAASKLRVSVDNNGRPITTRTGGGVPGSGTGSGQAAYYVDAAGIRRSHATGQAIDQRGNTIDEGAARRLRSEFIAAGRRDLIRPGDYGDTQAAGITYRQQHSGTQMGQTQADPSYNNPAAAAGATHYTPAYTKDPDELHIDGNDALAAVEDVRTLMQHFKRDHLIPKDVDDYDYLGEANRALFPPGDRDPQGTAAYSEFVEKIRTNARFRQGLQEELAETLNGRTLRGRVSVVPSEVFAQLRGDSVDSEAGKTPFDPPAPGTHESSDAVVTAAELSDSFDVQSWRDDQRALAQNVTEPHKQAQARENLRDFKLYTKVLQRLDEQRKRNPGRLPSVDMVVDNEEERAAFNRLNDHLAGIIRHGYQMDYDAGIETQPDESFAPDLGAHAPSTGGVFAPRRIAIQDVERGQSPANVANDHYMALHDEGLRGAELAAALNAQAKNYEVFASHRGAKGDDQQFRDVAVELRELSRHLPDPNG